MANRNDVGAVPTGGDFAAQMTWHEVELVLGKYFPATEVKQDNDAWRAEGGRRRYRKGLKVVEVGCGLGELSYLMQEAGLQVVAIDPYEAVINVARSRGVKDARQCGVEELAQDEQEKQTFDMVLFTRSLHHIGEDLDKVLQLVRDELLRPGGILVIEEFCREEIDRATAEWYYSLHDTLVAAGAIDPQLKQSCHSQQSGKEETTKRYRNDENNADQDKQTEWEEGLDALQRWQRQFLWDNHQMEGIKQLHLGRDMIAAIQRAFGHIEIQREPLLFRFIANHVDRKQRSRIAKGQATKEQDSTYEITRSVWRWENRLISQSKSILPLGILGVAVGPAN